MFDLEQSIAHWRRQMAAKGFKNLKILDELESHLRDDIRTSIVAGKTESPAFESAVERLGSSESVQREFSKIRRRSNTPVLVGSILWTSAVLLLGSVLWKIKFHSILRYAHTLTLTAGYLAAFLTGAFAICYICWGWLGTRTISTKDSFRQAIRLSNYLSAALVGISFFLGMLWCKQHFGTYWPASPRKTSNLWALAWLTTCAFIQLWGKISDRTRIFLALAGNIAVTVAWFGPWNFHFDQVSRLHLVGVIATAFAIHTGFMVAAFTQHEKTEDFG